MSNESDAQIPLPTFLERYFWDTDFARLRLPERGFVVIERLLEYGDDAAIHWLKETFSAEAIARVVRESRAISRRTANLWGMFLGIPREEIRCFSTPSILQHGSFSGDCRHPFAFTLTRANASFRSDGGDRHKAVA